MLITTRDRLVRPSKQRELAGALRAHVIEIDADHDLPLVRGDEYAPLTRLAVNTAAAAAGLEGPRQPAGAAGRLMLLRLLLAAGKALQGPHRRRHGPRIPGGWHQGRRRDGQEPLDRHGGAWCT